jgi:hypothetical protein
MSKTKLHSHNDKSFDYNQEYSYCDICAENGYQNEKVIFHYEGIRPEYEDGFIYKFSVYDYESPNIIHIHKSTKITVHSDSQCKKFIRRYYNNIEKSDQEVSQNPEIQVN